MNSGSGLIRCARLGVAFLPPWKARPAGPLRKVDNMKTNPMLAKLLAEFLDLNGICNTTNDPSATG